MARCAITQLEAIPEKNPGREDAFAKVEKLIAAKRKKLRGETATPKLITRILEDIEELIKQVQGSDAGLAAQRKEAISVLRYCRNNVKKSVLFLA